MASVTIPSIPERNKLTYTTAFLCCFLVITSLCSMAFNHIEENFFSSDILLAKTQWLPAHAGEHDTLFIGSSPVLPGIAIKAFDAQMAKNGHPTHSFSLSADLMNQFQDLLILRKLRSLGTFHPKYVFIEPTTWLDYEFHCYSAKTERLTKLHSPHNPLEGCAFDLFSTMSRKKKISPPAQEAHGA